MNGGLGNRIIVRRLRYLLPAFYLAQNPHHLFLNVALFFRQRILLHILYSTRSDFLWSEFRELGHINSPFTDRYAKGGNFKLKEKARLSASLHGSHRRGE